MQGYIQRFMYMYVYIYICIRIYRERRDATARIG